LPPPPILMHVPGGLGRTSQMGGAIQENRRIGKGWIADEKPSSEAIMAFQLASFGRDDDARNWL